jgi:dihydrofolate reductase
MVNRRQRGRHLTEEHLMKITVFNHVTLDGVMQAPAAREEDSRDGFKLGGWAAGRNDAVMNEVIGRGMATSGGLLLGRRTYEHFFSFWPKQKNNPFTDVLNQSQKYVTSNTLEEPLPWENSILLQGDPAEAVARLRGPDLTILGSGQLIQALMKRNLIDQFILLVHPVVLGHGRRMLPDGGAPAQLKLVESRPTTTGVVIVTYHRA